MEEKNVQLYPAKVRVVPNCKLAKITANRTEEQYADLLSGEKYSVIEKKKSKKRAEILSTYSITNAESYDGTDPLTFFDYCILSVCISEQLAGNDFTTAAVILRGLTGKVGKSDAETFKNQRAAILNSIEKLMGTVIKIKNDEVNKEFGYNEGNTEIITDTILPCRFVTELINGQVVEDTIYFYAPSPIFKVADQRNQIIRYDTELLDVPNQNNTPLVITLKNYVMLRVMEIIKHKMTPTITLADIFKKCRIDASDKKYNMTREVKKVIDKFLEHLRQKDVIKSFNWKKQGTKIHDVSITF